MAARLIVLDDVTTAVRKTFPDGSCKLYGSYTANLSTFYSDIDISVSVPHINVHPRHTGVELKTLGKIKNTIDTMGENYFKSANIIGAKVPIINVVHKCGVCCDISFTNEESSNNTLEILSKSLSPNFEIICIFMKVLLLHLGRHKINNMGLSSHFLYIMLGQFLQEKKTGNQNLSVGTLLLEFLNYYANKKHFNRYTVFKVKVSSTEMEANVQKLKPMVSNNNITIIKK